MARVVVFAAAAFTLFAAASAPAQQPTPPQGQPPQAQPPQPQAQSRPVLRLSYIPGNFSLPVLVGIEHGHFHREGLSLSILPVTEETTIMRSLALGGTDFAIGSQTLVLSIAENKLPIKVIAIAGYSREIELVVPAYDTTTKKLADIKGKTILVLNGVHNFDAIPELYRTMALSKPPMKLSDVALQFIDLVHIKTILDPKFRPTYAQRRTGGILMFREFTAPYVDEKKARVVASNEELTKISGRIGAQPIFASRFVLERDPKAVERFVRGWARTLQYLSDPANKEAVVRVLQIYYLRQYGFPLKKELAELYFAATKYDRLVWDQNDIAEVTINARALGAARNILFARIKEPEKRPFKEVPKVEDYMDMSFAKKALADLEAEKKAAPPAAKQDAPKPGAPEAAKPDPAKPGDKPPTRN